MGTTHLQGNKTRCVLAIVTLRQDGVEVMFGYGQLLAPGHLRTAFQRGARRYLCRLVIPQQTSAGKQCYRKTVFVAQCRMRRLVVTKQSQGGAEQAD